MPNWENIKAGIFAGESGGDYNALFGFSNRPGGQFSNVRLTDMTVDDAIRFSDPKGPYAQWVKNKIGRVATPMGGFQVVGTTLRSIKNSMGLSGDERLTPEMQDRIGQAILAKQGTGAWEGYKGPRQPGTGTNSTSTLPGKIGGDSMVARNFDPQVAAQTNTPLLGSLSGFGGSGDSGAGGGIDPIAAQLAAGQEKKEKPNFLGELGQAIDKSIPRAPGVSGGGGGFGNAGNVLATIMQNPQALAQALMKRRMV